MHKFADQGVQVRCEGSNVGGWRMVVRPDHPKYHVLPLWGHVVPPWLRPREDTKRRPKKVGFEAPNVNRPPVDRRPSGEGTPQPPSSPERVPRCGPTIRSSTSNIQNFRKVFIHCLLPIPGAPTGPQYTWPKHTGRQHERHNEQT